MSGNLIMALEWPLLAVEEIQGGNIVAGAVPFAAALYWNEGLEIANKTSFELATAYAVGAGAYMLLIAWGTSTYNKYRGNKYMRGTNPGDAGPSGARL